MLEEIGHAPGPELEFAEDRESYSLSAGLALGTIMLGVSQLSSLNVPLSLSLSTFLFKLILSPIQVMILSC